MSIFTKFLNEETSQKFTQVKDGTYKAQLKDIALEEGLYTEYGKADKVHFSFGIINEEKEVVLLKASLFRSNMLNSLMGIENITKEGVRQALEAAGIDPSRRAETLNLEEFARLSNEIYSML